MCGQAWLSFLYAKGEEHGKDKRRYLWVEEDLVVQAAVVAVRLHVTTEKRRF